MVKDTMAVTGAAAIVVGTGVIWLPLGLIVGGAFLLGSALAMHYLGTKPEPAKAPDKKRPIGF